MRRLLAILTPLLLLAAGCGDGSTEGAVGTASTTTAPAPTTTVGATRSPTTSPTTAPVRSTTPTPAEEVVDSGTSAAGAWRLVAVRDGSRMCAELRLASQPAGRACNAATEQDFNGNETLRYSTAADGAFVVGVSASTVSRVRAEVRDGAPVERATVGASFATNARFVALPLGPGAVIRALIALDAGGRALTRITVNP